MNEIAGSHVKASQRQWSGASVPLWSCLRYRQCWCWKVACVWCSTSLPSQMLTNVTDKAAVLRPISAGAAKGSTDARAILCVPSLHFPAVATVSRSRGGWHVKVWSKGSLPGYERTLLGQVARPTQTVVSTVIFLYSARLPGCRLLTSRGIVRERHDMYRSMTASSHSVEV
jgi:hypothetical protein